MSGAATYPMTGEFVQDGYHYCLGTSRELLEALKSFPFRANDVVIAGFCKTGTTWMQEIVYQILHPDEPIDSTRPWIYTRCPQPELNTGLSAEDYYASLRAMPSPRIFKTHVMPLYYQAMIAERKAKVIVMLRNPKDVLVSSYHYYRPHKNLGPFEGTWDEFFEQKFLRKTMHCGDFFEYVINWFDALQKRQGDGVLWMKYEDLLRDPHSCIRQVADLCHVELGQSDVEKIVRQTSFESMQESDALGLAKGELWDPKEATQIYFRKGQVGDWKNYFSRSQNSYVDMEYAKCREKTGIELDFE